MIDNNIDNKKASVLVSTIVENKPGVLSQILGLLGPNNINIESTCISNVDTSREYQRILILLNGDFQVIQLLVDVFKELDGIIYVNQIDKANHLEKEIALVKLQTRNPNTSKAMQIVSEYKNAKTIFANQDITVFEMNDKDIINQKFLEEVCSICECEILKSGIAALSLDPEIFTIEELIEMHKAQKAKYL